MMGHTDKATINRRRPLTPNMGRVLAELAAGPRRHRDLTQSDANACRALCDRGLASWRVEVMSYAISAEGRDVLKQLTAYQRPEGER